MHRATIVATLATLALASGAGAQDARFAQAQRVEVDLSNFKFTPSRVPLHHGRAYRLVLVNSSKGAHNFAAERFFAAAGVAPEDRAKVVHGAVDVDGGASTEVRLIAPAAGTYELHCSHFLHSTFGMKGEIRVD